MTAAAKEGLLKYEEARKLAASDDGKARLRLAKRADVQPEILYFLAEDPLAAVRRAIAGNSETPIQADLLLARDDDDKVRCGLAGKIGRLVPSLDASSPETLRDIAVEILEILARDQIVRVRQILAEALKDVAQPPELADRVIGHLARDSEVPVAAPVLEYSPLLTEEDLIEIIESGPAQGILAAIAARRALSGDVSDALVDRSISKKSMLKEAFESSRVMVSTASAQIREETLDRIAEAAPGNKAWHRPMVERPKLPARVAGRIASFIAESLLEKLKARKDLDAATIKAVGEAVKKRLKKDGKDKKKKKKKQDEPLTAFERAKKMQDSGELDEEAISQALLKGKRAFVKASLAVRSGLPEAIVDKMVDSKSAKGLTALAWKAGMDMRFAVQLQTRVAGIPPNKTLNPRNGTDFPLSEEDLKWQIEFFGG